MHVAALGLLVRYLGVHQAPLYPGEFGLDTAHPGCEGQNNLIGFVIPASPPVILP